MILSIETATPVCSVALMGSGGRITEKRAEGKGVHSEKTFLFIRELFDREGADAGNLDAVLFSNGPGSYTGLRIGAAAIKGLLFGKEVSLFTFPTLLAFAAGAGQGAVPAGAAIHGVIDARRNHLYHQKCSHDFATVMDSEVTEISELEKRLEPGDVLVGTGWERIAPEARSGLQTIGTEGISAVNLIKAFGHPRLRNYFQSADPDLFEPDYLTLSQVNNSPIGD
jgi:tRNA threonylcarbamoyladenosine biosynthesis protein TsaB